jgi:CRISPR-associated endonuclease/helicase Cas3
MKFYQYWAKAHDQNGSYRYHLFPYHCLDVVVVADVWLCESNTLLNQAAYEMDLPAVECKKIILFYIALHDLGKLDCRFQEFIPSLRIKLQGADYEVEPEKYDHGSYGYWHFRNEYKKSDMMKSVTGHHGSCNISQDRFGPGADDELIEMDLVARQDWITWCLAFFELDEIPTVTCPSILAGLCSVSDWIGSSITTFETKTVDLREYYGSKRQQATAALKDSGMLSNVSIHGFNNIFKGYEPRGIQKLISQIPVQAGLTIVESDTGSGKTEVAISYASELLNAGLADGIVFGLPTQATANGLFARLGDAAQLLFPDSDTTLAHSKSKLLIPDANGFLHKSNKRAFLGTMSVATIDQILMGVLPIKHQFIRSFGTRKSVLVLDEIHSFDAYMSGLIHKVLSGQHTSFSSVILLSATLPSMQRQALVDTYGGKVLSNEYPLITHVSTKTGETCELTVNEEPTQKLIYSELWESDELALTDNHILQIKHWVETDGASMCIICNTVADAQTMYRQLSEHLSITADLFHAKFTNADRVTIENHVLNKYGKHAVRQAGLLIATQVVEQSLDLDFDIMISQIAPIEYLMQRMGRLWRHDRTEGSGLHLRTSNITKPVFITIVPSMKKALGDYKLGYCGTGFVYTNVRHLIRTQQYITSHTELRFPDCYREAIELIHCVDAYENEPDSLTEYSDIYKEQQRSKYYESIKLCNSNSIPLSDVDPRSALLTRDGEMSLRVVLLDDRGELFNGGLYKDDLKRDLSTVSLSRKNVCGVLDEDNICYKAIVGKDISYSELGVMKIED